MKLSILLLSLALTSCIDDKVIIQIQTQDYEIHHAYGVILPVENPKGIITAREAIFYANHISFIDFIFESKDLRIKGKHAIVDDKGLSYEQGITEQIIDNNR